VYDHLTIHITTTRRLINHQSYDMSISHAPQTIAKAPRA
jgi:hypothetical protein